MVLSLLFVLISLVGDSNTIIVTHVFVTINIIFIYKECCAGIYPGTLNYRVVYIYVGVGIYMFNI
ncbi:hypothetical protein HBA_0118 [Sodalis endosymbiont of Henestaris halophilus]|nr:hypothetical protein HBA_0118 [Sodalis endosymbiont of Henestaris halophilus]